MMDLELITIEPQTALAVFTKDGALDPYLARVREEIDAFAPDMSSAKGRSEIKSFAFKITKVKTHIESVGKDLAAEQKEIPKKIDAARKHARETLDAWADEVRRPLTDYENAEKARVARHEEAVRRLEELGAKSQRDLPSGYMHDALEEVRAVTVGPECEEYEAAYAKAKEAAIAALTAGIEARARYEAEQAELAELRHQKEERDKKDREEQIAREASERARREVEEKAAADVRRAEEAAQRERDAADRREQDLKRAAEDAERRAAEAEAAARRRQEEQKAAEEAEVRRREADKEHKAAIHRAALQGLMGGGLSEETAKSVLKLIYLGKVPNVRITY
ncbi:hypothetical protein [Xanthobacter agilis]|uniref:Septal ring factor EnvC (AmiA/AmiB activator) n=1 Tax=Xanthobacter agilis TaxID=47492 RepID=A0ABU0LFW2_XANAG|nr:hypothetical protein [Xanthobacter agilis]MDQ0505993.1 septal ring factor EnvC (AmiA/AmiB activator) [Xanthobacter agilis]